MSTTVFIFNCLHLHCLLIVCRDNQVLWFMKCSSFLPPLYTYVCCVPLGSQLSEHKGSMGCIYGARFTISCFTACVTFADLVSCKNWYISSLLVLDNRQEELPGLRRRIVHINPPCRTELKWVFLSLEEKANGMFWYCRRKLFSENTYFKLLVISNPLLYRMPR